VLILLLLATSCSPLSPFFSGYLLLLPSKSSPGPCTPSRKPSLILPGQASRSGLHSIVP
jgi:hypothetical protein